jgi:hypothetical protein
MKIKRTTRLGKKTIAREQLEDVIDLFLLHRFVSALALAGAAEEIFKHLLHARGQTSAVDDLVTWSHRIRKLTGKPSVTDSFLYSSTYRARNQVKHHHPTKPEIEAINPFGEAYMMLQAAVANAHRLGIRARNEAQYQAWHWQAFGAQQTVPADATASAPAGQSVGGKA